MDGSTKQRKTHKQHRADDAAADNNKMIGAERENLCLSGMEWRLESGTNKIVQNEIWEWKFWSKSGSRQSEMEIKKSVGNLGKEGHFISAAAAALIHRFWFLFYRLLRLQIIHYYIICLAFILFNHLIHRFGLVPSNNGKYFLMNDWMNLNFLFGILWDCLSFLCLAIQDLNLNYICTFYAVI